MSFVQFDHVGKYYQTGEVSIRALSDVDFSVEQGEICVIVGPSGAGKTTLLNILGGMDSATTGHIFLDGNDISQYNEKQLTAYRRHDVGFVFQFYNLVPNLTTLENVELANMLSKNPRNAQEVLTSVGLGDRMQNFPAQLSGGEQQRVAIARALINRPDILLADEPTGNLDPHNAMEIMGLLEEINRQGTTVVVVTHSSEIVNMMRKRVITIQRGIVVGDEKESGYWYED